MGFIKSLTENGTGSQNLSYMWFPVREQEYNLNNFKKAHSQTYDQSADKEHSILPKFTHVD